MSELAYNCTGCGKPLHDDQPYGSIGGNIIPFIPAKIYHIGCIPTLSSKLKPAKCFAVVYLNYFPREIDSLWSTLEKAEVRVKDLNQKDSEWGVQEMEIQ